MPTPSDISIGYLIIGMALIFLPQFSRTERLVKKERKKAKRRAQAQRILEGQ